MKPIKLLTILTLLSSTAGAANYSNEVLAIGVGARALGMGGAYVAIADDSTAVYWNPAGLPKVKHIEIAAIQQGRQDKALAAGTNEVGSEYVFMSGAMSLPGLGTFGAAFMRFGVDKIPQVSGVLNPDGSPNVIGSFGTQDLAMLGSWGKKFHPAFSTGATLKMLSGGTNGLQTDPTNPGLKGDATYSYFGLDLGLLSDLSTVGEGLKGLSLGLNLQDALNSGVAWNNTPTNKKDEVALNAKAGLAYKLPLDFLKDNGTEISLAFDVDPKYGSNLLYHFGSELWYHKMIGVRGGFRQFAGGLQSMETSFGASFRMYVLQLDYAFIAYELTPIHYISLAVRM